MQPALEAFLRNKMHRPQLAVSGGARHLGDTAELATTCRPQLVVLVASLRQAGRTTNLAAFPGGATSFGFVQLLMSCSLQRDPIAKRHTRLVCVNASAPSPGDVSFGAQIYQPSSEQLI